MKRSATDATIRNVKAGNKKDAKQDAKVKDLERRVRTLEKAVERLIKSA